MTGKEIRNVTASVLAKLRNSSKSSGTPLQQVLQPYAMERFLYRISKSRHAQSVILKGETELIDEFGRIVDEVKISAMPALRSLTSGERLTKKRKAGRGWVVV